MPKRQHRRGHVQSLDGKKSSIQDGLTLKCLSPLPIRERHNMEYVMARYLSLASAVLAGLLLLVSIAAAIETLTITAEQAIVRAKPGSTHAVLTVVPQGAIFPV